MNLVDLHAHFFNTRYLPIEGVARNFAGRGRFFSRNLARLTRQLAADDDSLEAEHRWSTRSVVAEATPPHDPSPRSAAGWYADNMPDSWLLSDEYAELIRELGGGPPAATVRERREQLERLLVVEGESQLAAEGESGTARNAAGLMNFVRNILRGEKNLADDFFGMCPEVGLFVHMMMDMQAPFGSDPDYDYDRCVRRTRQLCRQSATRPDGRGIVAFVAFDAYRPESVEVVADALLNKSFVGVKFYPACGFRPDDNRNAKFAPGRPEANDPGVLDDRCARLFDVCVAHDVPIMAHCSQGGMEVVPDVTGVNSHPINWRIQLRDRPNLRVCFGHAGGASEWFPPLPADPWLPHIIELCATCPNVYLDISHKEELLDDAGRQVFAEQFAKTLDDHNNDPFPLSTKVIYGSDYPMPMPGTRGWTNYFRGVHDLFDADPRLQPHKRAVFRDNALRFLNLGRFLDARGGDLSDDQRTFLQGYRG